MSLLQQVQVGVTRAGIRAVIAAQEKMGKTTLISQAPNPLLIPLEVGFAGVSCAKTPMIQDYEALDQLVNEIIAYCQAGQFPYQTIGLDSATAIERHIHNYVIRQDPSSNNGTNKKVTMESCHGGYGKGYTMANTEFESLLKRFDILAVQYGINVVVTCHTFSSKVIDPTAGEYDAWDILLHSPKNQKTYGKREIITQWADFIGFMYEPVFVSGGEGKSNMSRAVSQNKGRVMGVSRTPSYVAGNRFGMVGEIPLPPPPQNGWNHIAHALYQTSGIDIFNRQG